VWLAGATTNHLRPRGEAPVTPVELFFDLVFAFAITQLSALLRAQVTPLGSLHTLMLFGAVWWVWIYTAWATNWLDPLARPVRLMLLALTLGGLVMAAAIPQAFAGHGAAFAVSYSAMQTGRCACLLWATRRFEPTNFRNILRIGAWFVASAVFWLAGAAAGEPARTWLWLAALAIEFGAPGLMFWTPWLGRSQTQELQIESGHMAERCAGFILIALGESVTVAGGTFYAPAWTAAEIFAVLAAFVGIVALWWIYFDRAAERTAAAFARAADRARIARSAYTYAHGLLVLGIVGLAAGDGLLLRDPAAAASLGTTLLLVGGPALYLAGNALFRWLISRFVPRSQLAGLALLAVIALVAPLLPVVALAALVSAALVTVIGLSEIFTFRPNR
jgi:low temperature requirement protein LtrA